MRRSRNTIPFPFAMYLYSLYIPMLAHFQNHGWTIKQAVMPAEEEVENDDYPGVYKIAKMGGDVAQRFQRFVQENLCMESWEFIVDAVNYEMVSVSPCFFGAGFGD